MDALQRIYQFQQSQYLTDLSLTFRDSFQEKSIRVHKIILVEFSVYFEKLLTFNKDLSEVTIDVPDVDASIDLIMSFYGQIPVMTNWLDELNRAKCRDYFGLEQQPLDISASTIIETSSFDHFLELCGIVGFDDDIIRVLVKNLPGDYKLELLSLDLLKKMARTQILYANIKIMTNSGSVIVRDLYTSETLHKIPAYADKIQNIITSVVSQHMATCSKNLVRIWDIDKGINIYTLDNFGDFSKIFECSEFVNKRHFAIVHDKSKLLLCDFIAGTIIYDELIGTDIKVKYINYSDSSHFLSTMDENIKIWNSDKELVLLYSIPYTNYTFTYMCFSYNDNYLLVENNDFYYIYSLETFQELIFEGKIISASPFDTDFDMVYNKHHTKNYLSIENKNKIEVWDIDKYQQINIFDKINYCKTYFSPNSSFFIITNSKLFYIYEVLTGKLYMFATKILTFTFSYDSTLLALCYKDQIVVYDVETRDIIKIIKDASSITTIEFSHDKVYIICENTNHMINIWNIQKNLLINTIESDHYRLLFFKYSTQLGINLSKYIEEKN